MGEPMRLKRGSGILVHLSSLPSENGIGDIGNAALRFIRFLNNSGQRYWQILPIGPTSEAFDNSPYTSCSVFAGNPLLISPEWLKDVGLLRPGYLPPIPDFSEYFVEFSKVIPYKTALLEQAFALFMKRRRAFPVFNVFCEEERHWLDDYVLFMSLKEENGQKPWRDWPAPEAQRDPQALKTVARRLAKRVMFHKFVQYCFYFQWDKFRSAAKEKGIVLVGDMPIYVALDSADVWAHQELFKLDRKSLQPTHVSGVPPDYFSTTGQRWGTPIYRWVDGEGHQNLALYSWWVARLRHTMRTVDIVRIDHFRGFEAFWEIPAEEETAINGRWVKGPGLHLFKTLSQELDYLPIIAEDLGVITPEVEELRDEMGFPGMKVLQFAFDADADNPHLPHNYRGPSCIVYTGTHDNDTTVGWLLSDKVPEQGKRQALRYANSRDGAQIHWDFIRMAYASVAAMAIVPLQDVLGFGNDCRMNIPSTKKGNWVWRCAPRFLTADLGRRLQDETLFYGRGIKPDIPREKT